MMLKNFPFLVHLKIEKENRMPTSRYDLIKADSLCRYDHFQETNPKETFIK